MTHGARAAALFVTLSLAVWTAPSAQGQSQLKKVPQPQPQSEGSQIQLQRSPAQPAPAEAVEIQRRSPAGIKIQPLQPRRPDAPILQRDEGQGNFERRVESMEQIQSQLHRSFDDFERAHRKALQLAQRIAREFNQCHERIYTQASYTQAERDAACSPADPEGNCLSKLLKLCIGSDADKLGQRLLALQTQSDEIATLLAPYQRGRTVELR